MCLSSNMREVFKMIRLIGTLYLNKKHKKSSMELCKLLLKHYEVAETIDYELGIYERILEGEQK